MNNITFDPSLNRRETPAASPVSVPLVDPGTQVLALTPTEPAPLARGMDEMWNDPHYAALYTNDDWFHRYTQQDGFQELSDLPEFPEMARGMLNRAFLSDVWGVAPAEIDDGYAFYQDTFARNVLGRPVSSESDFSQGVKDKFDESTSPAVEFAARLGRGGAVGTHETRAGFYAVINSLVRGQRNPYVDKTVEEARQDVPRLRQQVAEAEAYIKERLKSQPRGFVPPANSPAAKIGDLRHQLSLAELAAKGETPENLLGSLSRASSDLSDESREAQKAAGSLFDDQISSAHDDQWAMRVADSMGQSAAGTAVSFLNPALGMSLMYAQTFEASRAEYQVSAVERGLDPSDEAADRYAHEQALIQTPFELVGDVAIAKAVKGIFKSMPKKMLSSGPETLGHWLGEQSKEVAKSTAGEVLITTPAQTLAEALLAEGSGVRDATTWGEKGLSTLDAMFIALGQSGAMGGGSLATVGGIKTVKGDFSGRTLKSNATDQVPSKGGKFEPEPRTEDTILVGPESAIKFSKTERPHRLAKPRESTYDNNDERFQDPAFVLQSILRGVQRAGTSQRGKYGRELASASSFLAWSRENGAILDPTDFVEYKAGGGEHSVVFDEVNGRVFKLTKPGLFGAQAEDAGAYLERMALSNRVFGDDVKFEGIVNFPDEHAPRTVTSQSFAKGRDATSGEQADYLRGKGFVEHDGRWVHPILDIAVWDTQTPGNVITRPDGTMQAVDLQVEPATSEELRAVREKSGIGGEPVFSRKNDLGDSRTTFSSSLSRAYIDRVTQKIRKKWPKGPRVTVLHDENELHDLFENASDINAIREAKPEALYDARRQRVVLFPENFSLAREDTLDRYLERKITHEIVGHHGLSQLFEGDLALEYEGIINSAFRRFENAKFGSSFEKRHGYDNLEDLAAYYGFDLSTSKGRADAVEEHLARLSEDDLTSKWYDDLIHQITSLLRRLGLEVWKDSDTRALIRRSHRLLGEREAEGDEIRLSRDLTRADSIEDVIRAAKESGNGKKYVQIETIESSEAEKLPKPKAISLEGFRRMIDNFSIRHIEGRHGIRSNDPTPVTEDDIRSLSEILKAPGASGLAGLTDTGRDGILHVRYRNGWYFILEEARFGNRVLAVTSLWKRRPLASNAEALSPTSETIQGTAERLLAHAVEDFKAKRKR